VTSQLGHAGPGVGEKLLTKLRHRGIGDWLELERGLLDGVGD
jgi:hypothetical protein